MRYQLWRLPVVMEDEGMRTFIGERQTIEEIRQLREQQKFGYYYDGDFEILEVHVVPEGL